MLVNFLIAKWYTRTYYVIGFLWQHNTQARRHFKGGEPEFYLGTFLGKYTAQTPTTYHPSNSSGGSGEGSMGTVRGSPDSYLIQIQLGSRVQHAVALSCAIGIGGVSVHLSVTRWYCVKTNSRRIVRFLPPDSTDSSYFLVPTFIPYVLGEALCERRFQTRLGWV